MIVCSTNGLIQDKEIMHISREHTLLVFFPILLLGTGPIRYMKDRLFWPDPPTIGIVQPHGIFNTVFAGTSFQLFLVLYLIITAFKTTAGVKFTPVLPTTTASVVSRYPVFHKEAAKLAFIYVSITVLIVWAFGPSLFDRVNKWTGGHCDVPSMEYYRACVAVGGKYVNGFKSSGHSLITTIFGTAAVNELVAMNEYCRTCIVQLTTPYRYVKMSINFLVVFVYAMWVLLFLITCMFYHTFLERFVGTSIAVVILYTVYYKGGIVNSIIH